MPCSCLGTRQHWWDIPKLLPLPGAAPARQILPSLGFRPPELVCRTPPSLISCWLGRARLAGRGWWAWWPLRKVGSANTTSNVVSISSAQTPKSWASSRRSLMKQPCFLFTSQSHSSGRKALIELALATAGEWFGALGWTGQCKGVGAAGSGNWELGMLPVASTQLLTQHWAPLSSKESCSGWELGMLPAVASTQLLPQGEQGRSQLWLCRCEWVRGRFLSCHCLPNHHLFLLLFTVCYK